jgi:hypothetical protein
MPRFTPSVPVAVAGAVPVGFAGLVELLVSVTGALLLTPVAGQPNRPARRL